MEIRLKTTPSDSESEAIVDEHGAVWSFSCSEAVIDIFPATTKGPKGETVRGFYQNGKVFILSLSEATKYFSTMGAGLLS
ncbi:MAG: hypothetical protein V1792_18955 [Pseudomonadota bacterium]